jgi:hypothetical protein
MTSFTHDTAPTQYAEGGGIRFAYRRFGGPGRPPLVFYQHFMGTMDDHDPALSDALVWSPRRSPSHARTWCGAWC